MVFPRRRRRARPCGSARSPGTRPSGCARGAGLRPGPPRAALSPGLAYGGPHYRALPGAGGSRRQAARPLWNPWEARARPLTGERSRARPRLTGVPLRAAQGPGASGKLGGSGPPLPTEHFGPENRAGQEPRRAGRRWHEEAPGLAPRGLLSGVVGAGFCGRSSRNRGQPRGRRDRIPPGPGWLSSRPFGLGGEQAHPPPSDRARPDPSPCRFGSASPFACHTTSGAPRTCQHPLTDPGTSDMLGGGGVDRTWSPRWWCGTRLARADSSRQGPGPGRGGYVRSRLGPT